MHKASYFVYIVSIASYNIKIIKYTSDKHKQQKFRLTLKYNLQRQKRLQSCVCACTIINRVIPCDEHILDHTPTLLEMFNSFTFLK